MAKPDVSAHRLRELLEYDSLTGEFKRLICRAGINGYVGAIAGTKKPDGYICIGVDGCIYLAHRLAWLHVTGAWPRFQVDHIDGLRDNNAFCNLRDVHRSMNSQNQRLPHSRSKSGVLGAYFQGGGWLSRISLNGVRHNLGTFRTPELAHAAYLEAKRKLHPGCTI